MDAIKFKEVLEEVNSLHNEEIKREEEDWKLGNGYWRRHDQWRCSICNLIIDMINFLRKCEEERK